MTKYDFMIHYVQEHDCEITGRHVDRKDLIGFDMFCNAHTHGLDKFGYDELCIVMDLGTETTCGILNSIGKSIIDGKVFEEGKYYEKIIKFYPITFYRADKSKTMYVIFPDINGTFPDDIECHHPYNKQKFYMDIIEQEKMEDKL